MDWMAWTLPTALFFAGIVAILIVFSVLQLKFPSLPRIGILGFETMRGDRLFITLFGSAFIQLAWVGLLDISQYGALFVCGLFAILVFRWV